MVDDPIPGDPVLEGCTVPVGGREALFELAMRHASVGMALVTPAGGFLAVNEALCRILGRSEGTLRQMELRDVTHPDDLAPSLTLVAEVLAGERESFQTEKRYLHADGHIIWGQVSVSCLRQQAEPGCLFIVQIVDISDTRRAQQALREQERRYRLLAENASDVVCLTDADGGIAWLSPSVGHYLGWPPPELLGRSLAELLLPDDRPALAALTARVAEGCPASADLRFRTADGAIRWMNLSARPAPPETAPAGMISSWRDIQAEVEVRGQLDRALQTDPLTGLPSRVVIQTQLQAALDPPGGGGGETVAVLSIGVDRLTQVNNALTHQAGDQLLVTLATRLMGALDTQAPLARGTGDSFLVLLRGLGSAAEAAAIAERLRLACKGSLTFASHRIEPSVSIGIALAEAGQGADELLRDASLAMRQAALQGRDRVVFAERDVSEQARRELALLADLRTALDTDALQPWFMPVVDLASGELCGYEALVRWSHPDGRVDLPDGFLPAARRGNLAEAIDRRVLRRSITALASLPVDLSVAANVTATALAEGELAESVHRWLEEDGVAASRLQLEITETDLLLLTPAVRATIVKLADLGVRWLIDDFGTGYSSISHLRDLPIHGIKLDRSFTAAIGAGDQKSLRLAQALAGMAEGLGLETVAEGVETAAEAACLLDLGWCRAQGWHYGKAAPLPDRPQGNGLRNRFAPVSTRRWALAVTDTVPVGLYALRFTTLGTKEFLFVSRRWLEMVKLSREEVLADGSLPLTRIHPEDREPFRLLWQACMVSGEPLATECRLRVDGLTSWVRIEGIPQPQADGSTVWLGVMSDITDRRQQELDLRRILDNAPIGIAVNSLRDADPEITYLNRQFLRTLGYDRAAIPRLSDWARLAYPDPTYRAGIMARWAEALERARREAGAVESIEARVTAADGTERMVLLSAVILEEEMLLVSLLDITELRQAQSRLQAALAITEAIPEGTCTLVQPPDGGTAWEGVLIDSTDRIEAQQPLRWEKERLQLLAENATDGVLQLGATGRVEWVSASVTGVLGWPLQEVIGRRALAFLSPDGRRQVRDALAAGEVAHLELRPLHRDGSSRWMALALRQLADAAGRRIGYVGGLRDIDQQVRDREEMVRDRARLAMTLDSLLDPHLTLEPVRGAEGTVLDFRCTDANEAACSYLRGQRDRLIGAPLPRLFPASAVDSLRRRFLAVMASGTSLALNELAFGDTAGADSRFWDLRVVRVADRLSCSWRDVSDRVAAARRLAASEEQYRLLAENSSDVVMQLAGDGVIRWVSPSLTAMLGWQPSEWIGRVGTEFLEHRGDAEHYRANGEAVRAGSSVVARDRVLARDGSWHWVETHASPFRSATGVIDGIVATFRTIDAEVRAEEELARLARTDPLTGLLNRREMLERLDAGASPGERSGLQTAVLFCDLDGFKPINDRYGHAAGDQLLCAVAERIRGCLRPDDLAARFGGDELLVVLHGVPDLENAVAIAETIRQAAHEPVSTPAGTLRISLSIGVTLALPGEDSDDLIARADAAMYEAKQVGRNRVIPVPP